MAFYPDKDFSAVGLAFDSWDGYNFGGDSGKFVLLVDLNFVFFHY